MARGKAAAQSANRRTADALRRIEELQHAAAERDQAHRAEVADLKRQLAQAQNRLIGEVEGIAHERISEAETRARTQIREAVERHVEQVQEGWQKLSELSPGGIVHYGFEGCGSDSPALDVAKAFGVDIRDLHGSREDIDRGSRRMTARRHRMVDAELKSLSPREVREGDAQVRNDQRDGRFSDLSGLRDALAYIAELERELAERRGVGE